MAIITDKLTSLKFVEPESWQEGLMRLLAADAYRDNSNIGFGESGLVEHEIANLRKWCAKALKPLSAKEAKELFEARRKARQENQHNVTEVYDNDQKA
jgi:hypothetical protein